MRDSKLQLLDIGDGSVRALEMGAQIPLEEFLKFQMRDYYAPVPEGIRQYLDEPEKEIHERTVTTQNSISHD